MNMNPFNHPPLNKLKNLVSAGAVAVTMFGAAQGVKAESPNIDTKINPIDVTYDGQHISNLKSLDDTVKVEFSDKTTIFEKKDGKYILTILGKDGSKKVYFDLDGDGTPDLFQQDGGGVDANINLHDPRFNKSQVGETQEQTQVSNPGNLPPNYPETAQKIRTEFKEQIATLAKIEQNRKTKLFEAELAKKSASGTSSI